MTRLNWHENGLISEAADLGERRDALILWWRSVGEDWEYVLDASGAGMGGHISLDSATLAEAREEAERRLRQHLKAALMALGAP